MDRVAVLIVDDHTVVREGLRMMLSSDERVQVVGEAAEGQEAIKQVDELQPQVVLMDVRMPGLDGLETTRLLKAKYPNTAVVMLTAYDDDALVVDAVRSGAAGYLLKDASRDLLSHTIAAIAEGGTLVKTELLRRAISSLTTVQPGQMASPTADGRDELTEREHQVLQLVAEGQTNKAIGEALSLTEVTIKKHVQSIIAKLRASDRTNAVVTGLRMGLIS